MTASVIDGKAHAAALRARVADAVSRLRAAHGVQTTLAVVLVGDDPASQVYVRNKGLAAAKAGIHSIERRLPASAGEAEIAAVVDALNADAEIDGILVQMPLPPHVEASRIIRRIDPAKDVDGLTDVNAGRLLLGEPGLQPCTPQGCVILARSAAGTLAGAHAVVVGRSILVGKPLALLLLAENCTVTMAHSQTRNLADLCRQADILCAAVGRPSLVRGDWIKAGAVVIDVGINRIGDQLVGDVEYEAAAARASAITPVPGGVGPMTIACLLANTVKAAAQRRGLPDVDLGA